MKTYLYPTSRDAPRVSKNNVMRGSMLCVVLLFLVVFSILSVGLLKLASFNATAAGKDISASQAFWAAEAGIAQVCALAEKHATAPFESMAGMGTLPFVITGTTLPGSGTPGTYSVHIDYDPTWPSTNYIKKYEIVSTGVSKGGDTRVVGLHAELWTFANYMHASHFEQTPDGDPIYFSGVDVVDGPVYVNGQINIWSTPTFTKLVRSAATTVNYQNGGTASVFKGGLGLSAPLLDFQGLYSSDPVATVKAKAGLTLVGDYTLVFAADGTVAYTLTAGGGGGKPVTKALSSLNGAIYVNGNASVSGVVNGTVTVVAEKSIYIPSSITYASASGTNDPWRSSFNPAAVDDALGLMARQRVEVGGTAAINIHAAIMVTGDAGGNSWGFNATNKVMSIGQPKLNVYGSIAQYRRGVVGYVSGLGFAKNYKYDSRFNSISPPWWPYSTYLFSNWRQGG